MCVLTVSHNLFLGVGVVKSKYAFFNTEETYIPYRFEIFLYLYIYIKKAPTRICSPRQLALWRLVKFDIVQAWARDTHIKRRLLYINIKEKWNVQKEDFGSYEKLNFNLAEKITKKQKPNRTVLFYAFIKRVDGGSDWRCFYTTGSVKLSLIYFEYFSPEKPSATK